MPVLFFFCFGRFPGASYYRFQHPPSSSFDIPFAGCANRSFSFSIKCTSVTFNLICYFACSKRFYSIFILLGLDYFSLLSPSSVCVRFFSFKFLLHSSALQFIWYIFNFFLVSIVILCGFSQFSWTRNDRTNESMKKKEIENGL